MVWKKIKEFPNYSVSDEGEVRNDLSGRMLTIFNNSSGYKVVHISSDKSKKTVRVHRLVAQAFIANPQKKSCVNHINGNRGDNRVENLEWCTHSENNAHSYRVLNRQSSHAITAMTVAKFKPVLCVETNKIYESIKEAARQTGALKGNISHCLSNKRNTAGGYHWRYADGKI